MKVTISPSVDGFGEDLSVVVVTAAFGFDANTVPSPLFPATVGRAIEEACAENQAAVKLI